MTKYSKSQYEKDKEQVTSEINLKKLQINKNEKEIEMKAGLIPQHEMDLLLDLGNRAYDELSELEDKLLNIEGKNKAYNGKVIHGCGNN